MTPVRLWVLYVYEAMPGSTTHRTFVDSDEGKLHAYGAKLLQEKPQEVASMHFMVLPAEGLDSVV